MRTQGMNVLMFSVIWKYIHCQVYSTWTTLHRGDYDAFIQEMELKSNLTVIGICEYA